MREALKQAHPQWSLSEQRLRKVMKAHDIGLPGSYPTVCSKADPRTLDDTAKNPKPKVRPGAPGFYHPNTEEAVPFIPANAREEQIRFQKTSPRSYRLYGCGTKWDYAVTWNAGVQILVSAAQNKMKDVGMPVNEQQKQQWSGCKTVKMIFELLWPAAQRAGLTRDLLGKQVEAEWGGNPVPYIFYPRTDRELLVWEAQRDMEARSFKHKSMMILREMARITSIVKVDHRGEPIWDEEVNGQYVVILTRLHKGTDIECGDLPQDKGWDYDMPCSHAI